MRLERLNFPWTSAGEGDAICFWGVWLLDGVDCRVVDWVDVDLEGVWEREGTGEATRAVDWEGTVWAEWLETGVVAVLVCNFSVSLLY